MQILFKSRKALFGVLILFLSQSSFSQNPLIKQTFLNSSSFTVNDSVPLSNIRNSLFVNGTLNYLKPLTGLLARDSSNVAADEFSGYLESIGQLYSFVGDVETAATYFSLIKGREKKNTRIDHETVKSFKEFKLTDILTDLGSKNRLLMFNESHHIPLSRVFVASLLPQLKSLGFKYLALEALNGDIKLDISLSYLGYYTRDPQMRNLITYAQSLGFNLVQYEPEYSPGYNRDSLQAENILNVVRKDPDAKIVVLAGYGHIQEGFNMVPLKPMGTIIKEISNIDPVTIDLINFSSYSNSDRDLQLNKQLIQTFKPDKPVILTRDYPVDAVFKEGYDYYVLFPEYGTKWGRPEWLTLNTEYKKLEVKSIFDFQLIQAYKLIQGKSFIDITNSEVPSDQCYISDKQNKASLYLFSGEYQVVYRDIDYKIINSFKVLVK